MRRKEESSVVCMLVPFFRAGLGMGMGLVNFQKKPCIAHESLM